MNSALFCAVSNAYVYKHLFAGLARWHTNECLQTTLPLRPFKFFFLQPYCFFFTGEGVGGSLYIINFPP